MTTREREAGIRARADGRVGVLVPSGRLSQKGNELGFVAFDSFGRYLASFSSGLYPIYAIIRG
jgi:hypothetical protein